MAATEDVRLRPAVQYLRASTGLQTYSIEHQIEAIADYAARRGYQIVATYSDGARSGLDLAGRPALQQLLADALGPSRQFATILVFDVSRWGRFQNLDEGAHYEFLCRQAGVSVAYCLEPFENDGSPEANLIKQVKRAIAAEHSRALSERISAAKRQVASKGLCAGGPPPYGFRREVIDPRGKAVAILSDGERKIITGHRIRLVPGPPDAIATVRRVFELYVKAGLKSPEISDLFRAEDAAVSTASRWTPGRVCRILRCEAYVGVHVYGRSTKRLTDRRRETPRTEWRRVVDAWEPIIPRSLFNEAQRLLGARHRRSDQRMLADLQQLLLEHGSLNQVLIENAPTTGGATTYTRRFGSLLNAYELIGYRPAKAQS